MSITPQKFSNKLIDWYLENKRDLPWRNTNHPYFIWISEIILQQTRVEQGLPYYLRFVKTFPNIEALANASEEQVLKLWQGLGYYSRARNLHHTAKYIYFEYNGVFPTTYQKLIKLRGIGDYTASAIASICYHKPNAVVDGNVYRVLARLFGIEHMINESKGVTYFKHKAQELIDPSDPGTYNQAIMEFGARWCVPIKPDCDGCIFNNHCVAFSENKVSFLPMKIKKTRIKKIYYNYIVILTKGDRTILNKRTSSGIWNQLYEFPLIEGNRDLDITDLKKHLEYKKLSKEYSILSIRSFQKKSIIHKLSHRHIHTRFWIAESSKDFEKGVAINEIKNYPVPTLIDNFITSFFSSDVKV